jgi:hypothetical protein
MAVSFVIRRVYVPTSYPKTDASTGYPAKSLPIGLLRIQMGTTGLRRMSRSRGMRDGQQQVGFRQCSEQHQVVERLRCQDQGERFVSPEWRRVPERLVPLLGGVVSCEAVGVGAESD